VPKERNADEPAVAIENALRIALDKDVDEDLSVADERLQNVTCLDPTGLVHLGSVDEAESQKNVGSRTPDTRAKPVAVEHVQNINRDRAVGRDAKGGQMLRFHAGYSSILDRITRHHRDRRIR
jgi:hypothetical protein